jgi:hypothetical protein
MFVLLQIISWTLSPKIIISFMGDTPTLGELKNIFLFLMAYFPFRFWFLNGDIDQKSLEKVSLIFFLVFVLGYLIKQTEAINNQFWKDHVTNNGGYMLPMVLPLMSVFARKKVYWLFLIIVIVLTLLSFKRGAIVCVCVESIIFFYYNYQLKNDKKIIELSLAILLFVIFAYQFASSNSYLVERFHSDSSGREEIYMGAWNIFLNGDSLTRWFGYGFLQSLKINDALAHSDWFELLVDNGIVGVFLYGLVFIQLLRTYMKKVKYALVEFRLMFVMASLCWFTKSLFSMGYNSPAACMLMISLAISETSVIKYKRGYANTKYC